MTATGMETNGEAKGDVRPQQDKVLAESAAAAAAAGTGAVLTTMVFYPLELVKNRLQASTSSGEESYAYNSLADGLATIARSEGFSGLYTGLQSTVVRALASDFATVFFGELLLSKSPYRSPALELPFRIAGGWASVALTLPLELISTRVTCARPPISAATAAKQLMQEGGPRAFWKGMRVMLVLCVNPALTFTAFGWLRRALLAWKRGGKKSEESRDDKSTLSWLEAFFVGLLAKLGTMLMVYPLIRAKFVLQTKSGKSGDGLFQVLARLAQEEGISAWYSGLDAQLSKSLLSSALMLAVKEQTARTWRALLVGNAV